MWIVCALFFSACSVVAKSAVACGRWSLELEWDGFL
jgi:hypothetical protein